MKRQRLRKLLLIAALLLFPVTLYYFSPVLIINAGLNGIINGSFIMFVLMFILSIPFGRLFCAYLCPAGGLQECAFLINDKQPKQGWRNYIKYIIWTIWIFIVLFCYFYKGKIVAIDFLFETEKGISVSSIQSYASPMGIDIVNEIKNNVINNSECIQCGVCIDNCPKNLLSYGMIERKGNNNGK